jgi:hypothetical protein
MKDIDTFLGQVSDEGINPGKGNFRSLYPLDYWSYLGHYGGDDSAGDPARLDNGLLLLTLFYILDLLATPGHINRRRLDDIDSRLGKFNPDHKKTRQLLCITRVCLDISKAKAAARCSLHREEGLDELLAWVFREIIVPYKVRKCDDVHRPKQPIKPDLPFR